MWSPSTLFPKMVVKCLKTQHSGTNHGHLLLSVYSGRVCGSTKFVVQTVCHNKCQPAREKTLVGIAYKLHPSFEVKANLLARVKGKLLCEWKDAPEDRGDGCPECGGVSLPRKRRQIVWNSSNETWNIRVLFSPQSCEILTHFILFLKYKKSVAGIGSKAIAL